MFLEVEGACVCAVKAPGVGGGGVCQVCWRGSRSARCVGSDLPNTRCMLRYRLWSGAQVHG